MFALKMLLLILLYGFSYSTYMETCTFPVALVSIVWVHVLLVVYDQNCHLRVQRLFKQVDIVYV